MIYAFRKHSLQKDTLICVTLGKEVDEYDFFSDKAVQTQTEDEIKEMTNLTGSGIVLFLITKGWIWVNLKLVTRLRLYLL